MLSTTAKRFALALVLIFSFGGLAQAQQDSATEPPVKEEVAPGTTSEPSTTDKIKDTTEELVKKTEEQVKEIAKKVDEDPTAKKAAAGILQPIYTVAEALSFPAFHWLAFALMSAGVFSFALQLVLGKLVVLMRMGFSLKEIASDAVGLAISIVGLVLTTQAAAENSTFTQSAAAVISATVVGAFVGLILYFWGQAQELEAAAGRSRPVLANKIR
ncbi:hypothetical protein [Schlesneria paludicola]|uniref:hypothetical protein n=1 Tax=Schlesneria paludicola TaxID=360056 RepID=UPI00029B5372|nr:hypothetical protein [Schlesneria paludicola]